MKKIMMFILFVGMTMFLTSPAFAHSMDGQYGGKGCSCKMDKGQYQCPIAKKAMMKAQFLLENKVEIGLADDQIKNIKDIKLQMEKDSIRQGADMKMFMLDLESRLMEDKVDVEGVDAMIDKGFTSAAASAKSNLAAYAQLKGLLTADQVAKMKALHEQKEMKEKAEEEEKEK